jgi:ribosome recycling factor
MINVIIDESKIKMDKAIDRFHEELGTLRAGRANPKMLDKVIVNYYGAPTPINQLANISVPEPRMIMVQPFDTSVISDVEKGIQTSDLGLNPSNDGKVIRLMVPELTQERRKDLVKLVKKYGEECKVAIRNVRRHAIHDMKEQQKNGDITEDDLSQGEKEIQEVTDQEVKNIDVLIKEKTAEVMEV